LLLTTQVASPCTFLVHVALRVPASPVLQVPLQGLPAAVGGQLLKVPSGGLELGPVVHMTVEHNTRGRADGGTTVNQQWHELTKQICKGRQSQPQPVTTKLSDIYTHMTQRSGCSCLSPLPSCRCCYKLLRALPRCQPCSLPRMWRRTLCPADCRLDIQKRRVLAWWGCQSTLQQTAAAVTDTSCNTG
jgi:hypothetical protein